ADVRRRPAHPQRPVLHLLAQSDQEGVVVGELEPPTRQPADQGRHLQPLLEIGEDDRQFPQSLGDRRLGQSFRHQTISSIMKPTIARPLSSTMHSTLPPRFPRPDFRKASSMTQIEAEPTLPLSANVVNHFSSGIIAAVLSSRPTISWRSDRAE